MFSSASSSSKELQLIKKSLVSNLHLYSALMFSLLLTRQGFPLSFNYFFRISFAIWTMYQSYIINNMIFKSPFRSRSNSNDNVIPRTKNTKKDKLKLYQYVVIIHLGKNTPNQADESFPSSFAKKLWFWTKRKNSS